MKTKKFFALLLALAMMLSLCSCWEEEESENFWDESLVEEEVPVAGKSTITSFTLPYLSNQTLDPITCTDGVQQTVAALLYEGLFELDNNFNAQKVLCSDYSYDAESFTYRFTLRSDVMFSDGSSLAPSDVLAAYKRAAQSDRYGARFHDVASMQIVKGELIIRLTKGNSAFPNLLDIPVVKAGSEKDDVPLGTGPYLFVTESNEAYLLKNEEWWKRASLPLDRIELIGIRDNETAAYLFSSHEISMLVSSLTGSLTASFSGDGDEVKYAETTLLYLGFNVQKTPLNEPDMRCAVNTSIDRTQIVTALLAGHAMSADLPISPKASVYPSMQSSQSASIQDTLEAIGITEEKPISMTILVNRENSFKMSIADHLCRQLSCAALTLSVKALDWADYMDALQNGKFDLYLGEVKLTPDWNLTPLIGAAGALNYGRFYDEKTEELLTAFLADQSSSSAEAFCKHFTDLSPFAPIAFKSASVMTVLGLADGLSPTAANPFYQFSNWQFHFDL